MLYYKHQPKREGIHVTWVMPSGLAVRLKEASSHPDAHDYLQKYQATLYIDTDVIEDTSFDEGTHKDIDFYCYEIESSSTLSSLAYSSLTSASDYDDIDESIAEKPQNLGITSLFINFGELLPRDRRPKTDKGCYPCISLNNSSVIVEVNHQMGTNWMFCRVGHLMEWGIKWGHPSLTAPPKKVQYGSGCNPQVALNDKNIVVEVHKGQFLDRCFCRVGEVDPSTSTIQWYPSTYFNVGLHPVVAINNSSTVVAVFQDNVFTKHLNYRIGHIDNTMKLTWLVKFKQKAQVNNAVSFSVDINDDDMVVLSYQNPLNQIRCKIGKIVDGSINWTPANNLKCTGFTPSISINDNNEVILIHQSLARRHLVSNVGVARWDDDFKGIAWSVEKNRHYGKGQFPSVSLNNNGQVVEVHEPRMAPSRNRLLYYTPKLKYKS